MYYARLFFFFGLIVLIYPGVVGATTRYFYSLLFCLRHGGLAWNGTKGLMSDVI